MALAGNAERPFLKNDSAPLSPCLQFVTGIRKRYLNETGVSLNGSTVLLIAPHETPAKPSVTEHDNLQASPLDDLAHNLL